MPERSPVAMTLPQLTGRRSVPSLRNAKTSASVHSLDSSPSEPPTPTFSIRAGHGRYPSSNSSIASSPPDVAGPIELTNTSARLSKLAEEPPEPEDDCIIVDDDDDTDLWSCLCVEQPCAHTGRDDQSVNQPPKSPVFDFPDCQYGDMGGLATRSSSTKRSIAESSSDSITNRFTSRLQTWRKGRKPALSIGTGYSTPTRTASSRSSSLSSSAIPALEAHDNYLDQFAPSPVEPAYSSHLSTPVEIPITTPTSDPIDRQAMASTPLLPPVITEARQDETPLQSPLQSPTVADSTSSFPVVSSPIGTPQLNAIKTPPLSSRPSIASFRHRAGTMVSSSDIPPIKMSDPNDEWALKLGHANFTIEPEPYLPEDISNETVERMFADWQTARHNFTKHQVRTGEHFGITSKTYMLTEEKWIEVDNLWKKNYDLAFAQAAATSPIVPITPDQPEPLMKMPSLSGPTEKFPSLGDEDIVGPMTQIAAPIQQVDASRVSSLIKLLKSLKLPCGSARR